MKVATAAQMREIDRRAAEEYHLPGIVLMEAAGRAFADVCQRVLGGDVRGKCVAMICGMGNNGGDGFVAARHLSAAGATVIVFLAGKADALKGDAATHFAPLTPSGVRVIEMQESRVFDTVLAKREMFASDTDTLKNIDNILSAPLKTVKHIPDFALVGDALLGTGARSGLSNLYAQMLIMIKHSQEQGIPVVACDIPSGVSANTGK